MKRSRLLVLCVAVGLLAALVPAAHAADAAVDPVDEALALVDEALRCRIWADEPGGNPVVGSGGGSCNVGGLPVTAVVCLDYNGVTIATSCRTYRGTGSAGGSTNPTMCLPGLWQTQVTFSHMFMPGVQSRTHSDPVLLTCLP